MQRVGTVSDEGVAMNENASRSGRCSSSRTCCLPLPIYWMINMSFKTNEEILFDLHVLPSALHLGQLQDHLHR